MGRLPGFTWTILVAGAMVFTMPIQAATLPDAGMILHLDADAIPAKAGPIALWKDLSGRGNDVQQSDAAQQPLLDEHAANGRPALVFQGKQCLDGPAVLPAGSRSLTLVAVWKRAAPGGSEVIVEQASPGAGRRASLLTVDRAYGFNGESNDQHALLPFRAGRLAVSVLRLRPDGLVTLFHNGWPKSGRIDSGRENLGDDRLRLGAKIWGGNERFIGAIAEVLVYNRAVTDDEAKILSNALIKKWRVQVEPKSPDAQEYEEMIQRDGANPNRYLEPLRPQYHFTPIEGWMNDPNGLVYFRHEWYLFYQHDSIGSDGAKSWGLAVSKDLLHWQHRVPALMPDELGAIWSGSAVVDEHDTSGFFSGNPGLVCIFTYMNPAEGGRQSQGIAYSPDGVTFTKYPKNPVIPQLRYQPGQPDAADFRDPKVFWHEPTHRWVMIVAGGHVRIYSSPNLRDWTFESINNDIETECPDLFELPVEGQAGQTKWVLSGGGRWYMLGSFDGKHFTPESGRIPVNYGPDFYASQTWNDAPDGRRIMISWMYGWGYSGQFPGRPGGGMTIPVSLTLRQTRDGIRLFQAPVRELQKLRERHVAVAGRAVPEGETPLPEVHGRQMEVVAVFEPGTATEFGLRVRKGEGGVQTTIGYRVRDGKVFLDRRASGDNGLTNWANEYEAPAALVNGRIRLHLFVDWSSVEALVNDGQEAITCNILSPASAEGASLFAVGGEAKLLSLDVYPLKSVWRR